MNAGEDALVLPAGVADAMLEQARAAHPLECLGLLFGQGREVWRLQPLKNVSTAPETHFLADPEALLQALMAADAWGEQLVALYHSHPFGPSAPSPTDLEEARYDVPMIIVVPQEAILRAFALSSPPRERDIIVTVRPFSGR